MELNKQLQPIAQDWAAQGTPSDKISDYSKNALMEDIQFKHCKSYKSNVEEPHTKQGEKWSNQVEFVLCCVGYAVGPSNIWRFPYLCLLNGGGAFLVPYFISLFLCGIPLFFLEVCIGQFSGYDPVKVWDLCPLFKGLGYGMVIVSAVICIYQNAMIAWVLFYLCKSMKKSLPWTGCSNSWNTHLCMTGDIHRNITFMMNWNDNIPTSINTTATTFDTVDIKYHYDIKNMTNISASNITVQWQSPAEEYWNHEVLQISSGISDIGGIHWELFGCFIFSWVFVYVVIFKGVKSIGKVVYVTATAPYILLTILLIRGVTLPGAVDGIMFYIKPDWSKLLHFRVWATALLQVFYSLGPAWGGIIIMSSFNKFHGNCLRDSILIPIINGGTSFFGGFVVFSVVGFIANRTGRNVADLKISGPSLAFIAYPEALAELPLSPMWAILFFIMLFTVGIDSQFTVFEGVVCSLYGLLPSKLQRRKWLWTALISIFEAGIGVICVTRAGIYFFQIMDWYAAAFSVMIIAFFECIALGWVYGHAKLYQDIEMMLGKQPCVLWKVCWCFITPVMLLVSIIYSVFVMTEPVYGDYHYPRWAIGFGWILAMTSIIPLPVFFVKALLRHKGSLLQRLVLASRPSPSWRPADEEYKAIYKITNNNKTLTHF